MALPNAEKLTSQMAMLPDAALKQMAMMHKNDPYVLPLIISEDGRRKQMRQAAQAQMGGMPQPKVADAALAQMGQLPENQGIGQLPTPNIQRMADGGIAGYEDDQEGMATGGMGGMFNFAQQSEPVLRMAGGGMAGYIPGFRDTGAVNTAFEDAFRTTLRYEGGYVENDAGKGPSKFGINKAANPDVDIKNLTKDKARELYKKRYWDAIGGDSLAAKDPALAKVAFDTAVNMGVGKAKQLVEQSQGDPNAILALRQQHYDKLIENDPKKFSPYKAGWQSRLADLATSVIPSAQAGEPPKAAPKDLVSQIPGSKVAPPAPGEKDRYITGNQGVIGAGETALQYLTGAAALPLAGAYTALGQLPNVFSGKGADSAEMEKLFRERSGAMTYEPRTVGGKAVSEGFGKTLEDLKIPAYLARIGAGTPKGPAARPSAEGVAGIADQMKQVAAEKKAAVSTPRLEPPRTETPRMVVDSEGRAMPEDSRTRVANAFDDLSAAEKAARDAAAYEKAAIEAKNAPDLSKYAGVMDEAQTEAARARGISALASMTPSSIEAQKSAANADAALQTENQSAAETARLLRQNELPETPKPSDLIAAAKETVPTKERKGFGNDDLLMLGLSLLANKSPNFMTALGEAGIQTLGAKKEREKAETDLEYKDIMKKYYGSLGAKAEADAKSLEAGTKYNAQARQSAVDNISREMQKWEANPLNVGATPQQVEAKRLSLAKIYFPLAGLELPSTMSAPAPSAGFKVLGSRPQ